MFCPYRSRYEQKQNQNQGGKKLKSSRFHDSTADLKEMMTVLPMTVEAHAAILRQKVEARRKAEDVVEAAKQRRDSFTEK
jgi:hypothetical protein